MSWREVEKEYIYNKKNDDDDDDDDDNECERMCVALKNFLFWGKAKS